MNTKYYVVKKDNVVQEAKNFWDYIVLKLGLEPFIQILVNLFKRLFEQVTSLKQFEEINKFFDETLLKVVVFLDHLQLGKA